MSSTLQASSEEKSHRPINLRHHTGHDGSAPTKPIAPMGSDPTSIKQIERVPSRSSSSDQYPSKAMNSNGQENVQDNTDAKLNNPLANYDERELFDMGNRFARDKGLDRLGEVLGKREEERGGPWWKFGLGRSKSKSKSKNKPSSSAVGSNEKTPSSLQNRRESDGTVVDRADERSGRELWGKAALVAQNPMGFDGIEGLTRSDREVLTHEQMKKWDQPSVLYRLVLCCSAAAAVQGMDESVINGAVLLFPNQFGIGSGTGRDAWLVGLVTGAPYLACAFVGCWLTEPLNRYFGRRGAICITATVSFLTCIWSACTDTWWHLFIARFFLGIGIGPKSATVPIYAAECAPTPIRGALMFTAFGIMLGYVMDLAFYTVMDKPHITGLNWRLMLASAGIPALFVAIQVYTVPESPRWLMSKGRYAEAFKAMYRLRGNELLAARDIFYIHTLMQEENAILEGRNMVKELVVVPRIRRAMYGATIVMFAQQFCGINVIAYYSSTIFLDAGLSETSALVASWGFGMINFLFALPAVFMIDRFGRRSLLLVCFPLMALFLMMTGLGFLAPEGSARLAVVATGIYLFSACYSSGEGPVPFTYSAEIFPIHVRELGMAWATAVCWFFNFVLSLTWPSLLSSFGSVGAFMYYAAWNVILFVLVLLFMPESKGLSLEELDQVFAVPTEKHAWYAIGSIPHFFKRLMGSKEKREPLYHFSGERYRPGWVDKAEGRHVEKKPSL